MKAIEVAASFSVLLPYEYNHQARRFRLPELRTTFFFFFDFNDDNVLCSDGNSSIIQESYMNNCIWGDAGYYECEKYEILNFVKKLWENKLVCFLEYIMTSTARKRWTFYILEMNTRNYYCCVFGRNSMKQNRRF